MQAAALLAGGWCLSFGGAFLLWQAWRQGDGRFAVGAAAALLGSVVLFVSPQSVERGLAFFVPAFALAAGTFTWWQARQSPVRYVRELPPGGRGAIKLTPVLTRTGLARAYLAVCGVPAIAGLLAWATLEAAPLELADKAMLAIGVMIVSSTALFVVVLSAARLASLLLVSVAALGLIVTGLVL